MIMNFMRKEKGFISILLCIVLLPMITYATMIVDACRIQASRTQMQIAGDLAMNAGLSEFERKLEEMYGLFATCENPDELKPVIEQYFRETISGNLESTDLQKQYTKQLAKELTNLCFSDGEVNEDELLNFVEMKLNDDEFKYIMIPESRVSNPKIMKSQIVDYMKYKGPLSLTTNLLHKLNFLQDSTNQVTAVEKKIEFTKEVAKLDGIFGDAWEKLLKYNEVRDNYKYDKDGTDYTKFNHEDEDTKKLFNKVLYEHQQNFEGMMKTAKFHNTYLALKEEANSKIPSDTTELAHSSTYWNDDPIAKDCPDIEALYNALKGIENRINERIFELDKLTGEVNSAQINQLFDQTNYQNQSRDGSYVPSVNHITTFQEQMNDCMKDDDATKWDIGRLYDLQTNALRDDNPKDLLDKKAAFLVFQEYAESYSHLLSQTPGSGDTYRKRLQNVAALYRKQAQEAEEKEAESEDSDSSSEDNEEEAEEPELTEEEKQAQEDKEALESINLSKDDVEHILAIEDKLNKIKSCWYSGEEYRAYLSFLNFVLGQEGNQPYNTIGNAYQEKLNDMLVDYRKKSVDMEQAAYDLAQSLSKIHAQMGAAQKKGEAWQSQIDKVNDDSIQAEMKTDCASEMQNINANDVLALFGIPDDIGGKLGNSEKNGRLVLLREDFNKITCMGISVLDYRYYDSLRKLDDLKASDSDLAAKASQLNEECEKLYKTWDFGTIISEKELTESGTCTLTENINIIRKLDGLEEDNSEKVAEDEKFYFVLKNEAEAKSNQKPEIEDEENKKASKEMKEQVEEEQKEQKETKNAGEDVIPNNEANTNAEETKKEGKKGEFKEVNDAFTALRKADQENGSANDISTEYGKTDDGTGNLGNNADDFQGNTDSGLKSLGAAKKLLEDVQKIATNMVDDMYLEEYFTENFTCQTDKCNKNKEKVKLLNGYQNLPSDKCKKPLNTQNEWYGAEIEYILWGDSNLKMNYAKTEGMIFLIRFALNAIYAFQAADITSFAEAVAIGTVGWSGVLIPIVKVAVILGIALVESGYDLMLLKRGDDVVLLKNATTFMASPRGMLSKAVDQIKTEVVNQASTAISNKANEYIDKFAKSGKQGIEDIKQMGEDFKNDYIKSLTDDVTGSLTNMIVSPFVTAYNRVIPKLDDLNENTNALIDKATADVNKSIVESIDQCNYKDESIKNLMLQFWNEKGSSITNTIANNFKNKLSEGKSSISADYVTKMVKEEIEAKMKPYIQEFKDLVTPIVDNATKNIEVDKKIDNASDQAKKYINEQITSVSTNFLNKTDGALEYPVSHYAKDTAKPKVNSEGGNGITLNYKEYCKVFMFIKLIGDDSETVLLQRSAALIQANVRYAVKDPNEKFVISEAYTIVNVHATAKMGTLLPWSVASNQDESGNNSIESDLSHIGKNYVNIRYDGICGY